MSAERLREAAKVLRKRVGDMDPGPWQVEDEMILGGDGLMVADVFGPSYSVRKVTADFIATWDPGMALLLADWLDDCAAAYDTGPRPVWSDDYAERVAERVLAHKN